MTLHHRPQGPRQARSAPWSGLHPSYPPPQIPPTLGSLTRIKFRSAQMKWQLLTGLRVRWAGRPNFAPKTQFSPCHPLHEAAPCRSPCGPGPAASADLWELWKLRSGPIAGATSGIRLHCNRIRGSRAHRSLGSTPAVPFRLHLWTPVPRLRACHGDAPYKCVFSLSYLPPPPLPLATPASLTKEWLEEAPKSRRGQGQRPRGMPHLQPAAPALRPGSETRPHEKWTPCPFHVQIMGTYFFLRTNFTEKENLGLSPFLRCSSYNMDEP